MTEKERERAYVEWARSAGALLPAGDLSDSESPDFLIRTPGDAVTGIEVTRFSRQLSRAQIIQDEARLSSRRRARRIEARPRPDVKPEEVAAVIARKEERLPSYLGKAESVWLLIVFGAFRARSRGRVTGQTISYPFVTRFAGVVLFDAIEGRVWSIGDTQSCCGVARS